LRSDGRGSVSNSEVLRLRTRNKSIFAYIEGKRRFENTTLFVVVLNAIWICVDVEWNHMSLADDAGTLPFGAFATAVENCFCTYFTLELLIRFLAFRSIIFCVRDPWFVFDFFLVLMMVLGTWALPLASLLSGNEGGSNVLSNFSAFRLLRLLRLTRLAKIMRKFPELMTLLKGIGRAVTAVSSILFLLILAMFVFAIVFTAQLGTPGYEWPEDAEDPPAPWMFGDIGSSMMTLLTYGVLGDNLYQCLTAIKEEGVFPMWLFVIFMSFTGIMVLNMLIGILCLVVTDTSKAEVEQRQLAELQLSLEAAFNATDESGDGMVTAAEWTKMTDMPLVRSALVGLGLNTRHIKDQLRQMEYSLFSDDSVYDPSDTVAQVATNKPKGLRLEEFIDKLTSLRPDRPAKALELEVFRHDIRQEHKMVKRQLSNTEAMLELLLASDEGEGGASGEAGTDASSLPPGERPQGSGRLEAPCIEDFAGSSTCFATAPADPVGVRAGGAVPELRLGGSADDWLRDVPVELLFHVLKSRTFPDLESTHDSSESDSNYAQDLT
jgi:hypothetical protein